MNKISFWGAARTVTGSKHLIETGNKKILVDCGMFQGRKELRERNWQTPAFDPSELDAVVLTHAHMDHIGWLPRLMKLGYKGPIFCTRATKQLAGISLPDSGRIQEEDAAQHNKRQSSRHDPALPLYTEQDAYAVLKQFEVRPYHEPFDLPGKMVCRYAFAGHILGSAFAEMYFENGQRILMSGDLGRWNTPVIRDPEMMDFAEYLTIESTYGDRIHSNEDAKARLEEIANNAIQYGNCVLIPSFAIGRTQELLYLLSCLQLEGRIGRIPIYVDSPMATSTSSLYGDSKEEWDDEMRQMMNERTNPIEPEGVQYVRDKNMSKALNVQTGPMIVIAGSGMANGGRILHHFLHRLDDPRTVVCFTGYQAEETLGRRLLEGAPEVHIYGREVAVQASITKLNSLSAHADQSEIMLWLRGFGTPPKQTFIVHGEPHAQDTLAALIQSELGWKTHIPEHGETVVLN